MVAHSDNIARRLCGESVLVMFSAGADSIITLDLCCKYAKKVVALHLYWAKDLSFHERIIKHYEKRYNIECIRKLHPDVVIWLNNRLKAKIPQYKFKDVIQSVKEQVDVDWIAYGYRKSESLQRLSMITSCKGINEKNKIIYPIGYWSKNTCRKYIKKYKLPLPINYEYGFRDIGIFKGKPLLFIYNNFPKDYEKIKKTIPFIDEELYKAQQEI